MDAWKRVFFALSILLIAMLIGMNLVGAEGSLEHRCPTCGRVMEKDWNYCPYDGTKVVQVSEIPKRNPRQVVLAFYKAYAEKDTRTLAQCLDLEYILSNAISVAIDRIQELSPEVKATFKAKLVGPATRVLIPAVLDVLVSDAVAKEFPIPEEFSSKALEIFYTERIEGDIARFIPLHGSPFDEEIVLTRRNGRWFISKMPGF